MGWERTINRELQMSPGALFPAQKKVEGSLFLPLNFFKFISESTDIGTVLFQIRYYGAQNGYNPATAL
jgi:hypothetical protein